MTVTSFSVLSRISPRSTPRWTAKSMVALLVAALGLQGVICVSLLLITSGVTLNYLFTDYISQPTKAVLDARRVVAYARIDQDSPVDYDTKRLVPPWLSGSVCPNVGCMPHTLLRPTRDPSSSLVYSNLWVAWDDDHHQRQSFTSSMKPIHNRDSLSSDVTLQFARILQRMAQLPAANPEDDSTFAATASPSPPTPPPTTNSRFHVPRSPPLTYFDAPMILLTNASGSDTQPTATPMKPFLDIVITHVDGTEADWRAAAKAASGNQFRSERYRNLDELYFALKTLEQHASAIARRIILVVADRRHLPVYVRDRIDNITGNIRVEVVYLAQLVGCTMPNVDALAQCDTTSGKLPTFNSNAIETWLHRIPGLSKHFLYLNNDLLFGRPLSFLDLFRPVMSNPTLDARTALLDLKVMAQFPDVMRSAGVAAWIAQHGPVTRQDPVSGRTLFLFEPIVYVGEKADFARCSLHPEEHGRQLGTVHCFDKPTARAATPPTSQIWQALQRRLQLTVCDDPAIAWSSERRMTDGTTYDLQTNEPDPCDFFSIELYYNAYSAEERHPPDRSLKPAGTSAPPEELFVKNLALTRARSWYHFAVFPSHTLAHTPRLLDRDLLRSGLETKRWAMMEAVTFTRRQQVRTEFDWLVVRHWADLVIAERRAIAAHHIGLSELPVCNIRINRERAIFGPRRELGLSTSARHAPCIDRENDLIFAATATHELKNAFTRDGEERNHVVAKLFGQFFELDWRPELYRYGYLETHEDIAEIEAAIDKDRPLFVALNDGFSQNYSTLQAKSELLPALEILAAVDPQDVDHAVDVDFVPMTIT